MNPRCTWCGAAQTFTHGVVCTSCYKEGCIVAREVQVEAKTNEQLTIEIQQLFGLMRACEASVSGFNKRVGEWESTARSAEQYRSVVAKDYQVVQQAQGAQHAVGRIEGSVKDLGAQLQKLVAAHFAEKTNVENLTDAIQKRLAQVENTTSSTKFNLDSHLVEHENPVQEVDDPDTNERQLFDLLDECAEMLAEQLKRERSAAHRACLHALLHKVEETRADYE